MFSLKIDDKNIETDLISRIQIELKSSNTILNFIIYDERVNPKFGNYEQQLLLKRYLFLDHIWEQKNIKSDLVKILLFNYYQVKSQIPIIKELKISNNWNQKDTQSPINNDDRCIKSSNVKNVEYNKYGIPLGATLAELRGHQLGKLILIAKNNEKQNAFFFLWIFKVCYINIYFVLCNIFRIICSTILLIMIGVIMNNYLTIAIKLLFNITTLF